MNTTYVVENYQVNTYFANMIIRKVKETIKNNEELQQIYINEEEERIENQESAIEILEKKKTYWKKLKQETIQYGKDRKSKVIFPFRFCHNQVTVKQKVYTLEEFERYVGKKIAKIKANLYQAKTKLNRLNQQLENQKKKAPVSCFGTRALFKKQYTVDKYKGNHKLWKEEFTLKKHKSFVITGCKNHLHGSMCARYEEINHKLKVMSHRQGEIKAGKKYAKQEWFELPCTFKYREKEYLEALRSRENISYEVMDKGEYFIIKANFELDYTNKLNTSFEEGICSIDINVDRYAITNIDKQGNLLNRKVILFDLNHKTSNQITKELERVAIESMKYCCQFHKPLVREKLKKINFKVTKNAKRNRILSQFAYNKMISTLDRCFYQNEIMVFKTNPTYTSQEGKIKYMQRLGLSIDESAAFCIGRRFLLSDYDKDQKVTKWYYENLLQYKKYGTIKKIAKEFKKLKIDTFYRLHKLPVKLEEYKSLNNYVKAVNDYIYSK